MSRRTDHSQISHPNLRYQQTGSPLAGKLLSTPEKKEAMGNNNPMKRVGEANDIAEMTAFLLSDKSSWMTGQIIHIDGGQSVL